jgi:hypothetical protein
MAPITRSSSRLRPGAAARALPSTRLARKGMKNNATNSEPSTVEMMVMGSTRMNMPGMPGSTASGKNASTSVAVQPRMASRICLVPRMAASVREWPMRRCRAMFSTTTMESSTSRPSESTKPAMVIWFSE